MSSANAKTRAYILFRSSWGFRSEVRMKPSSESSSRQRRAPSAARAGRTCLLVACCPFLLRSQEPPNPPKPETVRTTVTVVEKIAAETPANVTVLDSTALEQSPGTNLDDRLRDVPGFSLFRRSSS